MKSNFIFTAIILISACLKAQNHDFTWYFGYSSLDIPQDSTYGTSIMKFDESGGRQIYYEGSSKIDFNDTNTGISDVNGDVLFFYNGLFIENASFQIMENGDSLNEYTDPVTGYDLPQGGLALPWPEKKDSFVLFHETIVYVPNNGFAVNALYYSIINMTHNGGNGKVVLKKEPLILDTLEFGMVTSVRHANGRDWWVIVSEGFTNRFHKMLLTPDSVYVHDVQAIGLPIHPGLGQAVFSPDGNWYAMYHGVLVNQLNFVDIYHFDRCTGQLSDHLQFQVSDLAFFGGMAISPNSRFLYAVSDKYIYQYDLEAIDIEGSEEMVALYDGFTNPFETRFYLAQVAPDGRIYISAAPGSSNYLHTIDYPNKQGLLCEVKQHSTFLPTRNGFSMPNFPNFRLGPLDGSPCDTLGLDNVPVAKFRYEQDSMYYLQVAFTDLSYYEPADWFWDLVDGSTSQDTSPVHSFPGDGTYEVCLMVSNVNGSNTYCRTLQLGTVATGEAAPSVAITVFPNPCQEGTNVILSDYLPKNASITLYDATGCPALRQPLLTGWNSLDLSHVPPGLYFYEIKEEGRLLKSGKLVRVE